MLYSSSETQIICAEIDVLRTPIVANQYACDKLTTVAKHYKVTRKTFYCTTAKYDTTGACSNFSVRDRPRTVTADEEEERAFLR